MGLDINAYSKLVKIDDIDDYEEWEQKYWNLEEYNAGSLSVLINREVIELTDRDFPGRTEGLEPGIFTINGEQLRFRAGSYGGYNTWRAWLCYLAFGVPPSVVWQRADSYVGKPFYELINFSDCEGYIGPVTAAKLAQDFAMYRDRAVHPDEWYVQKYEAWQRAFELAADSGLVDFS